MPIAKKIAVLDLGSKPVLGGGQWTLLRHSDFDGITDGSWWFGTSFSLEKSFPVKSVRRLCHILSPKEKGRPYSPSVNMHEVFDSVHMLGSFCHPGGLLPVGRPRTIVVSPSVYGTWVTRRLTDRESLEAWDYPPVLDKEETLTCSTSVTTSAPNKLLHVVARAVLAYHLSSGEERVTVRRTLQVDVTPESSVPDPEQR